MGGASMYRIHQDKTPSDMREKLKETIDGLDIR